MSAHTDGAFLVLRPTDKSSSENHIAYPKLLNGSQTRLVHIQHEPSSSKFVASLEVIDLDLDSRTTYDALSYHCGDPTPVSQVHLADLGIHLPIARNLTDALGRVLKGGIPGPFWIDAISINQLDIEERNQQVRMMTRIFSGARQVLSWLGPDDGTFQKAIRLIKRWADPCKDLEMSVEMLTSSMHNKDHDSAVEFVAQIAEEMTQEEWAILKAFYDRPYFRRAWIVQEISVARKVYVLCGDFPLFDFNALFPSAWWLGYHMRRVLPESEDFRIFESGRVIHLYKMRQHFQDQGAVPHEFDLAWVFESFDPRDKFFATQGILDMPRDIRHHFEVDYARPIWLVYAEAARGIIKASRSLHVLTFTNSSLITDYSWPSWVPRFDGKADKFISHPERDAWTPDLSKLSGIPHASPGTEPCLRDIGQPRVLSLLGMKQPCTIASVMSLGPKGSVQGGTDSSHEPTWIEWPAARIFSMITRRVPHGSSIEHQITNAFAECTTMKYRSMRKLHKYSHDGGTILADFLAYLQAYLDIILPEAGAANVSRKSADDLRIDLEELNQVEEEAAACLDSSSDCQQSPAGDMNRYILAMVTACSDRNFFITRDGRMGVGPAETKQGDEIVVFYGAATPFVIRWNDRSEQWHLIGSAVWVVGLMDGEALKVDMKEEEWFDLA